MAYPNNTRPYRAQIDTTETGFDAFGGIGGRSADVAYPDSGGVERQRPEQQTARPSGNGKEMADSDSGRLKEPLRTSTGVFAIRDAWGISSQIGLVYEWWETEPNVGRVANGIPSRVDRLRGLGNAVVPQVAEVIGRLVVEHAQ